MQVILSRIYSLLRQNIYTKISSLEKLLPLKKLVQFKKKKKENINPRKILGKVQKFRLVIKEQNFSRGDILNRVWWID